MITNMINERPLPVCGDGQNVRVWIYVDDHVSGVRSVLHCSQCGLSYDFGGDNAWQYIRLVMLLCKIVGGITGKDPSLYERLVTYVTDRAGHDKRYAIDCDRRKSELDWSPRSSFEEDLKSTTEWYFSKA